MYLSAPRAKRQTGRVQGEIRYARSNDVSIAYTILGEGPLDVVWVPGAVSNVEFVLEEQPRGPVAEKQLDRL